MPSCCLPGCSAYAETLPPDRRTSGGFSVTLRGFWVLIQDRIFLGTCFAAGLSGASMFAYIAGATFVLQRSYGLSAVMFSLVFATNSLGIIACGQIGARLSRLAAVRVLALALMVNLAGALAVAITVFVDAGFWWLVASLFVMVSSVGWSFRWHRPSP